MAELANGVAEAIAAILRAFGYVGRPRKRASIHDDLALLRELIEFPGEDFGPGTAPQVWLVGNIYQQIGEFVGFDFSGEKRKADLSSVFISAALAGVLAWVSYYLISRSYGWWAAFPITVGSFMAYGAIAMFFQKEPIAVEGNLTESEDQATADRPSLSDIQDLGDEEIVVEDGDIVVEDE